MVGQVREGSRRDYEPAGWPGRWDEWARSGAGENVSGAFLKLSNMFFMGIAISDALKKLTW